MKKTKKKLRLKKRAKIILIVVAALLLVGIALGIRYWYNVTHPGTLFDPPASGQEPTNTPASGTYDPSDPSDPSETLDPMLMSEDELLALSDTSFMQNRANVLVLGVDSSEEREGWGIFRTDTMILVTVDFSTNSVDMISVPRDSYVKIITAKGNVKSKRNPYARINTAYGSGGGASKDGWAYAMNTVSNTLGVPVDYYFGFNMDVVKEVVDAMGGIDYNVDVEIDVDGLQVHTGQQLLNGEQVLAYCRQRKGSSDIARIDRQQRMLMAILKQLKDTGRVSMLPKLYQAVAANVATNLSFEQISALSYVALKMDMANLTRHTVEASTVNVGDAVCLGVRVSKLKTLLKEIYGTDIRPDPENDFSFITALIEEHAATVTAGNAALSSAKPFLTYYPSDSTLKSSYDALAAALEELNYDDIRDATSALSTYVSGLSVPTPPPTPTPVPADTPAPAVTTEPDPATPHTDTTPPADTASPADTPSGAAPELTPAA